VIVSTRHDIHDRVQDLDTGFGFGDFVKQARDIKLSSTGPLIIPGKIPVGLGPVHPMTYLITTSTPLTNCHDFSSLDWNRQ